MGENMNEPVAWMSVELNGRTVLATYEFETAIPLYTHPAKTLTDEEIMAITEPMFVLGDKKMICDFARAIMERCGIISGTDK
jgi:hypothetical protein